MVSLYSSIILTTIFTKQKQQNKQTVEHPARQTYWALVLAALFYEWTIRHSLDNVAILCWLPLLSQHIFPGTYFFFLAWVDLRAQINEIFFSILFNFAMIVE